MANKFGTFKGVFIPSTEAILGTVLFLLLPTLIGYAGLIPMLAVIVLSHTVTVATSFSLADCATNLNTIGGGGMYALGKRSLGKAFGGSIGIQLYLAQAASIGFYCIGFVEPLYPVIQPFLETLPLFQGLSPVMAKKALALIVFTVFFVTVMVGADFTLKIQLLILFILFGSVIAIFISPLLGLKLEGTPLYNGVFNLFGKFERVSGAESVPLTIPVFFLVFTQFFPAVTGIDAGVGMSGDLKDPKKSLVTGTFTAIAVTFVIYIGATFIFSLMDKNVLVSYNAKGEPVGTLLTDLLGFGKPFPLNLSGIMVFIGILFATMSSALSCFMTAPRTAQSLCRDNTLPRFLDFLKRDFKKEGTEPRFATLVTYGIGFAIIWFADINAAAVVVGICFLVVYGWVNGSAFLERISGNPTFRPTSKGHWVISLYGLLACLIAISLFNLVIGIAIIVTQLIIFQLILYFKTENRLEGVWWGVLFSFITKGLAALNKIIQGTKNWRPILSAFAFNGKTNCPLNIAYLAESIAAYKGIVNLNIIKRPNDPETELDLPEFSIDAGKVVVTDPTQSILAMIQMEHPGDITPNTVLLEYIKGLDSVSIIRMLLAKKKNLLLLKNGEKLEDLDRIDIWWRGERNGNLMVLLAYIMRLARERQEKKPSAIRIIRKIEEEADRQKAYTEMVTLLEKARLSGEVVILPPHEETFMQTLARTSSSADLVMMGLPGNFEKTETGTLFKMNEFFFDKEIEKYGALPAILFVKSAYVLDLLDD